MSKLIWHEPNDIRYEFGIERGVLYLPDGTVEPWVGLITVTEITQTDRVRPVYLNGQRQTAVSKPEEFDLAIESLMYPPALDDIRGPIPGMSYTTLRNNHRQIHLVYNPWIRADEKSYSSLGDETDPVTFSWQVTTKKEFTPNFLPTAHLIIDVPVVKTQFVENLESLIYGDEDRSGKWFDPNYWITIFSEMGAYDALLIVDHGDGTWSAIGDDSTVYMVSSTEFWIDSPSVTYLDADTYTVESL